MSQAILKRLRIVLLKKLSEYNSVFFDCDGVILQSNDIKTAAFRKALEGHSEDIVDEFLSYHMNNGGVSRYVKFEYYYKKIYGNYTEGKVVEAITRYSKIVRDELLLSEYVPGFLSVLNYFNSKKIPCYVVSGGAQDELMYVFEQRGIVDKFSGVYGSPKDKVSNMDSIDNDSLLTFPAVFFGDSRSDMEVAIKYSIEFCFVSQFTEWRGWEDIVDSRQFFSVPNFESLQRFM